MPLKSMKLSKSQAKVEAAPVDYDKLPEYPYGLRISLETEQMKALGLDMPKVGTKLTIVAEVEVVSCHASQYEGGEEHRSCSMQITDMAVEGDKPDPAGKLYGGAA
jgi:hypothetical protein